MKVKASLNSLDAALFWFPFHASASWTPPLTAELNVPRYLSTAQTKISGLILRTRFLLPQVHLHHDQQLSLFILSHPKTPTADSRG